MMNLYMTAASRGVALDSEDLVPAALPFRPRPPTPLPHCPPPPRRAYLFSPDFLAGLSTTPAVFLRCIMLSRAFPAPRVSSGAFLREQEALAAAGAEEEVENE
ncbi:hypothetical protein GQX73_g6937 [Xylaria multiplex]|uniref:Uncharacterized protein n=1 Tax=Xylaria multiplex TaxID=323545 RepID=A0A7C8IUB7_9PEZI|nr:hypothetical protein GQX73_g6937 [Xylaria multiplex]